MDHRALAELVWFTLLGLSGLQTSTEFDRRLQAGDKVDDG